MDSRGLFLALFRATVVAENLLTKFVGRLLAFSRFDLADKVLENFLQRPGAERVVIEKGELVCTCINGYKRRRLSQNNRKHLLVLGEIMAVGMRIVQALSHHFHKAASMAENIGEQMRINRRLCKKAPFKSTRFVPFGDQSRYASK